MTIRRAHPVKDRAALRKCTIELQEFERTLEPTLPPGEDMADAYLDHMLARCTAEDGAVFIAEDEGTVAGFITVLCRVMPDAPDETEPYTYISDLVVLPDFRNGGIGRALLDHAEMHARESGAKTLRISALARNDGAIRLYQRIGFRGYRLELTKQLEQNDRPASQ